MKKIHLAFLAVLTIGFLVVGAFHLSALATVEGGDIIHVCHQDGEDDSDSSWHDQTINSNDLGSPEHDGDFQNGDENHSDDWCHHHHGGHGHAKLVVNKVIVGNQDASTSDFSFSVDEGPITQFEADGSNDVKVKNGTHTVVENPVPANYTVTYSNNLNENNNCTDLQVGHKEDEEQGDLQNEVVHLTPTCTITNTFNPSATIHATKIVCDSESDLPDWGDKSGPDITSATATNWVNGNQDLQMPPHPNCHIVPWTFEWAPSGAADPGDTVAHADGWTPFVDGTAVVSPVPSEPAYVWVREQVDPTYIPFSGASSIEGENGSAEMYCHTDHFKYDNRDRVDNMEIGGTYNCIGFNVLKACDATAVNNIVVSDTTNTVSGPDFSGSAIATFVHAAWASAAALGDGATWIWDAPFVTAPATDQDSTFTKTFTISGAINSANIDIATDNGYLLKINGTTVVDKLAHILANEHNYEATTAHDVASLLHSGLNTVEVTVRNFGSLDSTAESNPAGLLYKLVVNENDCLPPPPPVCGPNQHENSDHICVNDPAHIVVIKNTIGGDGTFHFTGLGEGGFDLNTAEDDDTPHSDSSFFDVFAEVSGTTYNITEGDTQGWDFTSANCKHDELATGSPITHGDSIIAHPGDQITCTFINTKQNPDQPTTGTLKVIKRVVGGNNVPGDFSIHVKGGEGNTDVLNSPQPGSETGTDYMLTAGSYNVSETGPSGYITSFTGCTSVGGASVVVGQTTTCTVINTKTLIQTTDTGGGGGGGGGRFFIPPQGGGSGQGQVLGAATDVCSLSIDTYMRKGYKNDPANVKILQNFLNGEMGSGLVVNGIFDSKTEDAVKAFQLKYKTDIMDPWHVTKPTGIVYKTTLRKIKNLMCPKTLLPIPTDLINWSLNHREVPPKV